MLRDAVVAAREHGPDDVRLVAYVVAQSRGAKMHVTLDHPKEKEAYEMGRRIFFFRAGANSAASIPAGTSS